MEKMKKNVYNFSLKFRKFQGVVMVKFTRNSGGLLSFYFEPLKENLTSISSILTTIVFNLFTKTCIHNHYKKFP